MKEIKAPLETRYNQLNITATCKNPCCCAGFELEGKDIRIHRKGNPSSYSKEPGDHRLSFLCPHCNNITYVQLEDEELQNYIKNFFKPVYFGEE